MIDVMSETEEVSATGTPTCVASTPEATACHTARRRDGGPVRGPISPRVRGGQASAVRAGTVALYYGQLGLGIQYRMLSSVGTLAEREYLRRIR